MKKLEKLIGKKIEVDIIEDSGAFGGIVQIDGEDLDFIVGRLEGNKTIYSTGLKSGKARVIVKQLDISGNYRALFVEPDNSLTAHEVSGRIKNFLVDSQKMSSFDEFLGKYSDLEDQLINSRPKTDKEKEILNRFQKRYIVAKDIMVNRWKEQERLLPYQSGSIRIATLADLKDIESLTTNFYRKTILDPEGVPDVSEVMKKAENKLDHFFIQEHDGKKISSIEYNLRIDEEYPAKPLPYLHALGIKDTDPKAMNITLYNLMNHLRCPGFFTDICTTIEDINFYKAIGFRKIASFKQFSSQFKKELPRALIYLDPKRS